MIDSSLNEYIKKEIANKSIEDKELLDFLSEKIKTDPPMVKKILLFKFLYKQGRPTIYRKDITSIANDIYYIFITELKILIS